MVLSNHGSVTRAGFPNDWFQYSILQGVSDWGSVQGCEGAINYNFMVSQGCLVIRESTLDKSRTVAMTVMIMVGEPIITINTSDCWGVFGCDAR